ncbi:DNA alkylation repair protein [Aquabacterium sp. J223]|uniref:DNA alkylation repair protein n=1 Tax=Aquabacterium sp. J223 TaxID=2898431 RepID=UPI0021AE2817|nr:DNA alkylation repair protein [Aquabacterium sp. J223]UUX94656.1 DNA alkylation repair protein [Aquabacterium sp. J223]
MEPFKNLINPGLVRAMATHLARVSRAFDRPRFEAGALAGLEALELKARALHVCDALEAALPNDFATAAGALTAALGPAGEGDDLSTLRTGDAGLGGWAVWPMSEYVARHGHADVPLALQTLHAMTQRFSAEWAIRPFIQRHPDTTFATLQRWTTDPSAHVRRLVSEGSRPRLPWGLQLKALIVDPSPTLPLLRALQDDESAYVRRSVANHLNDIAKDHPALVVQWLHDHLPGAPAPRQALLRHACRTLVKQGHPQVLQAWGLGTPLRGEARLTLSADRVVVGGSLRLEVRLQSTRRRGDQALVIDYAVHHVKARGGTSAKVFKGWRCTLAPGQSVTLSRPHSFKPITTRRYHAGRHRIELLVNGRVEAEAAFELAL